MVVFPLGTPLLDCARALGVDLDSVCGGRGICGRCQVALSEGEFAKHAVTSRTAHLSATSLTERRYAEKRGSIAPRRLACSTTLQGDVVIDVPLDSQVHRQVVRKRAEARAITLDTTIQLAYVGGRSS